MSIDNKAVNAYVAPRIEVEELDIHTILNLVVGSPGSVTNESLSKEGYVTDFDDEVEESE